MFTSWTLSHGPGPTRLVGAFQRTPEGRLCTGTLSSSQTYMCQAEVSCLLLGTWMTYKPFQPLCWCRVTGVCQLDDDDDDDIDASDGPPVTLT